MLSAKPFTVMALLLGSLALAELTPYTGPPPRFPANRSPFGFGSLTTGGSSSNSSSVFLVDNMPDLRTALSLPYPRTVYVQGNITGHQITFSKGNGSTYGDCQWFIDTGAVKQFNFTRYVMSLNESYMESVGVEAGRNGTIEGVSAGEFLTLLKKMNVSFSFFFSLVQFFLFWGA